VGAYFLTNSLRSTDRKYTFCVLVLYVPLRCVVYWGWVQQLKKRIHIYHFRIAYCLVSCWIQIYTATMLHFNNATMLHNQPAILLLHCNTAVYLTISQYNAHLHFYSYLATELLLYSEQILLSSYDFILSIIMISTQPCNCCKRLG